MTPDARLTLAETIARLHGERVGIYMPCERDWWAQPHVLGPILDAARVVVAAEVQASYPGLDGDRPEPFTHDAGVAA